jgi:hypothetical protein
MVAETRKPSKLRTVTPTRIHLRHRGRSQVLSRRLNHINYLIRSLTNTPAQHRKYVRRIIFRYRSQHIPLPRHTLSSHCYNPRHGGVLLDTYSSNYSAFICEGYDRETGCCVCLYGDIQCLLELGDGGKAGGEFCGNCCVSSFLL